MSSTVLYETAHEQGADAFLLPSPGSGTLMSTAELNGAMATEPTKEDDIALSPGVAADLLTSDNGENQKHDQAEAETEAQAPEALPHENLPSEEGPQITETEVPTAAEDITIEGTLMQDTEVPTAAEILSTSDNTAEDDAQAPAVDATKSSPEAGPQTPSEEQAPESLEEAIPAAQLPAEKAPEVATAAAEPPEEEVTELEAVGDSKPAPLSSQSEASIREYLDNTVVPVLRDGLRMLIKERPEDPCEYLMDYIKAHHP